MDYNQDKENKKLQKSFCEQKGAGYVEANLDKFVGVALDTLSNAPLNGLRHPQAHDTSGWFFWGGSDQSLAPDFYQPVHLGHLLEEKPEIIKYLGLAPGWRFLIDVENDYEDVWFDEKLLHI